MSDSILLAEGSITDCEGLIEKFSQASSNNLGFVEFANVWRASNFELILCGRSDEELISLTNELLGIGKKILTNSNRPYSARVGGLYLIYGFYFKQNNKCKVRFTLQEIKELISLLEEFKEKGLIDPIYIFYKLLVSNAFLFNTTSTQYIQLNQRKSLDDLENGDIYQEDDCRLIECEGFSASNLNDINMIASQYEKMKEQLPGHLAQGVSASNKHLVSEIVNTIEALKNNLSRMSKKKSSVEHHDENQGETRRRIVKKAFQSKSGKE